MNLTIVGSNQTVISLNDGNHIFFSYNTPVAAFLPGVGYVVTEEKHSTTTTRHINSWAGKDRETQPQSFFDELVKTA